ncbi:hypothetical protein D3C84_1241330 [compost metagenome]
MKRIRELLRNERNEEEITGIINVHKRLKNMFGSESGLEVTSGELGGVKIIMKLDINHTETDDSYV